MQKTKIEYLDLTWNPIKMRCTPVSSGCANCWHLAYADRLTANPRIPQVEQFAYAEEGDPDKGPPVLNKKELERPYRLSLSGKKSARIGVQFMGDLFHKEVDQYFIREIYQVIHQCSRFQFFILTKRPDQARLWYNWIGKNWQPWPIPNVWFGVSIEDQPTADERISILLQIPAAHRWVSIEPMLGPIDLTKVWQYLLEKQMIYKPKIYNPIGIDWIVLGGETGPKARPMHPDWVRSVRDQCQAAGVPFFFKGWGDRVHNSHPYFKDWNCDRGDASYWIGKKRAGHLLDGREWNEMP